MLNVFKFKWRCRRHATFYTAVENVYIIIYFSKFLISFLLFTLTSDYLAIFKMGLNIKLMVDQGHEGTLKQSPVRNLYGCFFKVVYL